MGREKGGEYRNVRAKKGIQSLLLPLGIKSALRLVPAQAGSRCKVKV